MAENRVFFTRSVFKSLSHAKRRISVIFIAIFLGACVSAAFLNLYFDTNSKMSKELKAYGANFIISARNSGDLLQISDLNSALAKINKQNLISHTPYLYGFYSLGSTSAVVAGVEFEGFKKSKPLLEVREGSFGLNDFSADAAFLGVNLAKSLEVKVGQSVEIRNPKNHELRKVIIKGIFYGGDESDDIIYIDLNLAQELAGVGAAANYADAVIDGNFETITQIAQNASSENVQAKPIARISLAEGAILDKIKALMMLIAAVVLIISSTSVNTTLSSIIFSRKKEIALNLSLGATNRDIIKLFGAEIAILTILASVLGAFAGYFLSQILGFLVFNSSINFRFLSVIFAVIISLLCSFFAAFYPIKEALKVNLVENLRGE